MHSSERCFLETLMTTICVSYSADSNGNFWALIYRSRGWKVIIFGKSEIILLFIV